jgi:hypothetical protein
LCKKKKENKSKITTATQQHQLKEGNCVANDGGCVVGLREKCRKDNKHGVRKGKRKRRGREERSCSRADSVRFIRNKDATDGWHRLCAVALQSGSKLPPAIVRGREVVDAEAVSSKPVGIGAHA